MNATDFFLSLFASLRASGISHLEFSKPALHAGTRAALRACEDAGLRLEFRHKAMAPLVRNGLAKAESRGILSYPNPSYDQVAINLPSKTAAKEYLLDILSPEDIRKFRLAVDKFVTAFDSEAA